MRTALEIAIQLDELLKRSKPFRNFNEVFSLTSELISTLSPSEVLPTPEPEIDEELIIEESTEETPVIIPEETGFSIEDVMEEPIVEESPVTEEPVVAKKTTKKK